MRTEALLLFVVSATQMCFGDLQELTGSTPKQVPFPPTMWVGVLVAVQVLAACRNLGPSEMMWRVGVSDAVQVLAACRNLEPSEVLWRVSASFPYQLPGAS